MSNYQNLDRDFAQMHVRDQGGGADYQRIPPATAPKPKAYTSAPAPFKPGNVGQEQSFIYPADLYSRGPIR